MITWIPDTVMQACCLQLNQNFFNSNFKNNPKRLRIIMGWLVPFFQKKFAGIPVDIFEEAVCERLEPSIDKGGFYLEGDDLLTRCKKKMKEKGLEYIPPMTPDEWNPVSYRNGKWLNH